MNKDLVFTKRTREVLYALLDGYDYAFTISLYIKCTYSHILNIIKNLKELKLITVKFKGKTNWIKLTPKGKMIATKLRTIERIL